MFTVKNAIKPLYFLFFVASAFSFFFPSNTLKAGEIDSKMKSIINLMDSDTPVFSNKDSELTLSFLLKQAKPIKKIEPDPDLDLYQEYPLSELNKVSKRLFGKVISLKNIPNKPSKNSEVYYNSKKKLVCLKISYQYDGLTARLDRRVKKVKNHSFKVIEKFTQFHPSLDYDLRATKEVEYLLSKNKKAPMGYFIKKIKLKTLKKEQLAYTKKDVENHIRNIKKWYGNPPKNSKLSSKKDANGDSISLLSHEGNPVFIMITSDDKIERYYYKEGVLIRYMLTNSSDKKKDKLYTFHFKNNEMYVNEQKFLALDFELQADIKKILQNAFMDHYNSHHSY